MEVLEALFSSGEVLGSLGWSLILGPETSKFVKRNLVVAAILTSSSDGFG